MNKIGKYYSEARGRAQQKKSPWNWVLFPLSIIGIGSSGYFLFELLLDFQHHLIPAGALFSSGFELGYLLCLPLLFLSIPLGLMFANLAAWCILSARRSFENESNGIRGTSFKESMKQLCLVTIVLLLISAPLSLFGILNYFYITPRGLNVRPLFSFQEKHYQWDGIVKIHGKFWVSGGTAIREFVFYMKDGSKIDLSGSAVLWFVKASNKIKPFLNTQHQIIYDYSIVNTGSFGSDFSDDRFVKFLQNKD